MFKPNKKAAVGLPWQIIIIAVIGIVVMIGVLLFWKGGSGKLFDSIGGQIDTWGDDDDDGIINMRDQCPCKPIIAEEDDKLAGCPKGTTEEAAKADDNDFRKNKGC